MKRFLDIGLRYGVAMLAVGAALGIKLLLDPLTVQDTPFLLVFGAIIVSTWYGGLGPGLLATVVSALATDYFFLYPRGTLTGFSVEGIDVLAFMLEGVLVSVLTSSLRSARDRPRRMRNDLERRRRAHTGLRGRGDPGPALLVLLPGRRRGAWTPRGCTARGAGRGPLRGGGAEGSPGRLQVLGDHRHHHPQGREREPQRLLDGGARHDGA